LITSATLVLCLLCVRKEPPTPPSRSTAERRAAKEAARALVAQGVSAGVAEPSFWRGPLVAELGQLSRNRQFFVLLVGVGIGLGLFNAVTTLIEQLVKPAGYSKDDAGNFGALLIGCGLGGAAVVGPLMDKLQAYNRMLKVGLAAAFGATIFMLLSLRPNNYAMLCGSFGVLGCCMLPLLPLCMECAAECTYPVSEDAASGLMLFAGNLVGIIMIFSVGELIADEYSTVFNKASIVLAVLVVGLGYDGPLRRQAAERAQRQQQQQSEQQDSTSPAAAATAVTAEVFSASGAPAVAATDEEAAVSPTATYTYSSGGRVHVSDIKAQLLQ
jgi:MFS family permease